ncbi:MAG: DUF4465 domain-containing protein [Crocinitomicaceae bacterium]
MRKILLFTLATAFVATSNAQYVEDFEMPVLAADTAWYGQDQVTDGDTIYSNGTTTFELNYNSGWGSFTGWAVSSETDNVTPGYGNQFAAITGEGANSSNQYGVCYASQWSNNRVFYDQGAYPVSFQVTNTAYAYHSMLNGDSFGKKFGEDTSATGVIDGTNGEDWFLLTIYAIGPDSLYNGDSINFYLADYRFANDADDYIVDEWENVDLTPLDGMSNSVIGLDFVLSSSDTTGGFGMNTPSYFAMDNFSIGFLGMGENATTKIEAYPNPTNGNLTIVGEANASIQIYDLNGRLVYSEILTQAQSTLDLAFLENGIYTLISVSEKGRAQSKIVKQ